MALGYPHPDHMLRVLTSKQIGDWIAFSHVEPIGLAQEPDAEDIKKEKAKQARDNVLAQLKKHKNKHNTG